MISEGSMLTSLRAIYAGNFPSNTELPWKLVILRTAQYDAFIYLENDASHKRGQISWVFPNPMTLGDAMS
jgi:hypothetical protein